MQVAFTDAQAHLNGYFVDEIYVNKICILATILPDFKICVIRLQNLMHADFGESLGFLLVPKMFQIRSKMLVDYK